MGSGAQQQPAAGTPLASLASGARPSFGSGAMSIIQALSDFSPQGAQAFNQGWQSLPQSTQQAFAPQPTPPNPYPYVGTGGQGQQPSLDSSITPQTMGTPLGQTAPQGQGSGSMLGQSPQGQMPPPQMPFGNNSTPWMPPQGATSLGQQPLGGSSTNSPYQWGDSGNQFVSSGSNQSPLYSILGALRGF